MPIALYIPFELHFYLQWWQLESLRVLFYEAKVPTSDGYSTIKKEATTLRASKH